MPRSLRALVITIILMLSGLAAISFVQGRHQLVATKFLALPTSVPTVLSGLPDIQYVPLYPNASITSATIIFNGDPTPLGAINPTEINQYTSDGRSVTFEAQDSPDKVYTFYKTVLPQKGWVWHYAKDGFSLYSWTDPEGKSAWQLYLQLTINSTLDNSRTLVKLEYGRYPAIEAGLPVFPDARQTTVTQTEASEIGGSQDFPAHVTDVTYLSQANPLEIGNFYNNSMIKNGWTFFDRFGKGEVKMQTGDIDSQEGLFFRSTRLGWDAKSIVSYQLFVTASVQDDGITLVRLHARELQITSGNY